jgi:transcription elongation factor S-II
VRLRHDARYDARQDSQIGKYVFSLRKHADARVTSRVGKLVQKWKALLPASGPPSATAPPSPPAAAAAAAASPRVPESPKADAEDVEVVPDEVTGKRQQLRVLLQDMFSSILARAGADVPAESRDALKAACTQQAAKLEQVVFDKRAGGDESSGEYAEHVRLLFFSLQGNRNLVLSLLQGDVSPRGLCGMTAEELKSDDLKSVQATARRKAAEAVQLDWEKKHKAVMMEQAGIKSAKGQFICKRCNSNDTDYSQKQTRSADEPMTTFVYCNNCGNRWRF